MLLEMWCIFPIRFHGVRRQELSIESKMVVSYGSPVSTIHKNSNLYATNRYRCSCFISLVRTETFLALVNCKSLHD